MLKRKVKKSLLMNIVIIILVLWTLLYLFNETPLFYKEPQDYKIPEKSSFLSKEAAPIFITHPKKDTVILFLHGYKGTPYNVKKIARFFAKKYNIIMPLYPGHGTTIDDFQKTYFSQWYNYVRSLYIKYRKKYKRIYICGISMGGVICLKLAEEFNSKEKGMPDGVITVASPVFFNKVIGEGVLYDWRLYFSRIASWFVSSLKEHKKEVDEDGAEKWLGYEGQNFLKQVHSFKMGMYYVRKNLSKIKAPLLLMHSRGDKTAPFENLFYIARCVSSDDVHIRMFDLRQWDHKRHLLSLYHSTINKVQSEINFFISR